MLFSVSMFVTDYAMKSDELARAIEERGFESFWIPEHSHIPVDRLGPSGVELPRYYWHTLDPFVVLSVMASVTTRLKLGTGVCLVPQRDPIQLAKEVSSLDFYSRGRFLFGVGGGWNRQEMGDHGTDYRTRWRRMKETIEAMKVLWNEDEAEFHGEFVSFDRCHMYPKPVQRPSPPIHQGGFGPGTLDRVVDYCDGWFPLYPSVPDFPRAIAELRQKAEAAGRDPGGIEVSTFFTPPEPAVIERLREAGVQRVIFTLPPADREKVLPHLDSLAEKFLAHV
ncbi:MAG: LLM class F420-dependent oxidoreductase [Armatimonadetes bacterium]|nr:LLM class F420-dependent oxidoreductase [Armatimonadota bacterium]